MPSLLTLQTVCLPAPSTTLAVLDENALVELPKFLRTPFYHGIRGRACNTSHNTRLRSTRQDSRQETGRHDSNSEDNTLLDVQTEEQVDSLAHSKIS